MTAQELIAIFQQCLDDHWGYIWGTAGVLWTQARQNALDKTTDENRAMSRKYGSRWIGHMVADCSGMFVFAFKKYGLGMSHISSNIYKSYCTKTKGKLTAELKKNLRPGTAVFTGQTAGNHPHVGLYVGGDGGYVIEAHGTMKGVIKSKLAEERWTFYGELKNVDYNNTEPAPAPEPEPQDDTFPTLRRGSKGKYVTLLQVKLISQGYSCGSTGADGDFGQNTEKAVKLFQQEHDGPDGKDLKVDGIVGPATWWALDHAPERITYTVTIKNLTAEQKNRLMKDYPGAIATPED